MDTKINKKIKLHTKNINSNSFLNIRTITGNLRRRKNIIKNPVRDQLPYKTAAFKERRKEDIGEIIASSLTL